MQGTIKLREIAAPKPCTDIGDQLRFSHHNLLRQARNSSQESHALHCQEG